MNKITIVIPVYNVEKCLEKCINSVLEQTYKNLEIILVNDGSTDQSGKMCDMYKKIDNRVRVIHKKNGGLSSARNAGKKIATGDYISFIDSDDYIEKDYFETLYKAIIETNSDIAAIDYIEIIENGVPIINAHENIKKKHDGSYITYEGIEIIKELLNRKTFKNIVCNKLYKHDILKRHMFKEGMNYEDIFFTFNLIMDINKITFVNKIGYYYVRRKGSICYSPSEKNLSDFLDIAIYRFETIEKKQLNVENYNCYALLDVMISVSIKYLFSKNKYDIVDRKLDIIAKKIVDYTTKYEDKVLFLLNDFEKVCLYLIRYDRNLFYNFLRERQKIINE